jgi:hypothetical protein
VNTSQVFSPQGGSGQYSFSVKSGNGSITNQGIFTAGSETGTTVIALTDGINTVESTVTINPSLSISPSSALTSVLVPVTFNLAGGVPPYSYQIVGGEGSISDEGVLLATNTGLITIKASDSQNTVLFARVTVNSQLQLTANSDRVLRQGSLLLKAKNGIPPYQFSIVSGDGNLSEYGSNGDEMAFYASNLHGSVTFRFKDAS